MRNTQQPIWRQERCEYCKLGWEREVVGFGAYDKYRHESPDGREIVACTAPSADSLIAELQKEKSLLHRAMILRDPEWARKAIDEASEGK